jgi:hypothetical protein
VSKATGVKARVFVANAPSMHPPLPVDFWSAGKPFTGTPLSTNWSAVGAAKSIAVLEAGEPGVFYWPWNVSKYGGDKKALLAVVTCNEDPLDEAAELDVPTLVRGRKHVALRQIQITGSARKTAPKKTKPKKPVHPKFKKPKPRKPAKKKAKKK